MKSSPASTRPYRMQARAEAAAATGERILDAAVEVFWERPTTEISLAEVARRAQVSVQTVIRRFGGREGLFAAAWEREVDRVRRQREATEPGDTDGAVRDLIEHYEEVGDRAMRLLADENDVAGLREVTDVGRDYHREWCERAFGSALTGRVGADRRRRLAQLVAVTDVYVWKLLRRDRGLSRPQTELAIRELLEPLLAEGG